ncbi:MAG: C39 family peptidase [Elusimicrobia bacterium]|nr:C39 family peptidase [Elusimicrobiota bacterium]
MYEGDIEDLKTQVREGRPIIAFINRGTRMFPIGHYVVVTGYSESRRGLFVHSGDTPNRFVPTSRFLKQWEKPAAQRCALMARSLKEARSDDSTETQFVVPNISMGLGVRPGVFRFVAPARAGHRPFDRGTASGTRRVLRIPGVDRLGY